MWFKDPQCRWAGSLVGGGARMMSVREGGGV